MSGTDLLGDPVVHRSAEFLTPDIRISLGRHWGPGARAFVLGCNPSEAGDDRDDPTSSWLIRWFTRHGFGGYDLGNLYPFVSSKPEECRRRAEQAFGGPNWNDRDALHHNLEAVVTMAKRADQVFVGFGAIAWDQDWVERVVEEIQTGVEPWPDLWCWGTTASGAPKHPMARGVHRIDPAKPPVLWRAK